MKKYVKEYLITVFYLVSVVLGLGFYYNSLRVVATPELFYGLLLGVSIGIGFCMVVKTITSIMSEFKLVEGE